MRLFALINGFARDRSATSAVEFALIMPIFMFLLFSLVAYGTYLGIVHGLQQITAEAARSAVAGLTDSERLSIATSSITTNVTSYPFLSASALTVQSAATDANTGLFSVTVRYDASSMFIFNLPALVPAPNPIVTRTASIQRGGY